MDEAKTLFQIENHIIPLHFRSTFDEISELVLQQNKTLVQYVYGFTERQFLKPPMIEPGMSNVKGFRSINALSLAIHGEMTLGERSVKRLYVNPDVMFTSSTYYNESMMGYDDDGYRSMRTGQLGKYDILQSPPMCVRIMLLSRAPKRIPTRNPNWRAIGYSEFMNLAMAFTLRWRACDYCHSVFQKGILKQCSGCASVYYCDISCQKKHWKVMHKVTCTQLRIQRNVQKKVKALSPTFPIPDIMLNYVNGGGWCPEPRFTCGCA